MNYFLPSVKLIERLRIGSRVRRKYDKPQTPFERLVSLGVLSPEQEAAMRRERQGLNPFLLSAVIEQEVRTILTYASASPRRAIQGVKLQGALSQRGAEQIALRENAPVRSYVAR